MRTFGNYRLQDVPHTETPTGTACMRCEEDILVGDTGVLMPLVDVGGVREIAYHHECFLRGVLGSVGHQQKKCSCYGGTEEDPLKMTRREAARAAVALHQTGRLPS